MAVSGGIPLVVLRADTPAAEVRRAWQSIDADIAGPSGRHRVVAGATNDGPARDAAHAPAVAAAVRDVLSSAAGGAPLPSTPRHGGIPAPRRSATEGDTG